MRTGNHWLADLVDEKRTLSEEDWKYVFSIQYAHPNRAYRHKAILGFLVSLHNAGNKLQPGNSDFTRGCLGLAIAKLRPHFLLSVEREFQRDPHRGPANFKTDPLKLYWRRNTEKE